MKRTRVHTGQIPFMLSSRIGKIYSEKKKRAVFASSEVGIEAGTTNPALRKNKQSIYRSLIYSKRG